MKCLILINSYMSVCLTFSWLFGIFWSVLPLFGKNQYVLEGFKIACSFDYIDQSMFSRVVMVSMNIFGFFVPVIIILLCYAFILFYLKKHSKYIKANKNGLYVVQQSNNSNQETSFFNSSKLKNSTKRKDTIKIKRRQSKKNSTKLMVELLITKKMFIIIIAFSLAW